MKDNIKNDEAITMLDIKISNKKGENKYSLIKSITKYLLFFFQIIIIILLVAVISFYKIKKKKKVQKIELNNLNDTKLISETKNNTVNINKTINNIINDTKKENNIIEKKKNDTIYNLEELKYDSIDNAADRAKDFIKKSSENKLFNNKDSFKLSENPKISVVIPLYNAEHKIKRAISSIQNQNFSDFEIILVNDLSKDNSLKVIEGLQKEDSRIKIINNKNNMGILYSRCVGTLAAKGKYIFPLDDDDMFLDKDVFYKIVIETAEKDDFDIVEFRFIETEGLDNFFKKEISADNNNKHKKGIVVYQPELSGLALKTDKNMGYNKTDLNIWGKCIKSIIYKKVITLYGEERYSNNVINFEDSIMNYIIFQYAQNFTFIPKYGILRIISSSPASSMHTSQSVINKFEMRLLDAVIDFSSNTFEGKQIVANLALKLLGNSELKSTIRKDKYRKLLKSILERILKCENISSENKDIIRKKGKSFIHEIR